MVVFHLQISIAKQLHSLIAGIEAGLEIAMLLSIGVIQVNKNLVHFREAAYSVHSTALDTKSKLFKVGLNV